MTEGEMMKPREQGRRHARKTIAMAAAAAIAIVAIILGARAYLYPSIEVEDLVANQPGLGNVKNVTTTYCANEIGCKEAWDTQYGVYMKFETRTEATHWATIFGGEGAQWKRFVLDARDRDLSSDERVTAVQILLVYDGV